MSCNKQKDCKKPPACPKPPKQACGGCPLGSGGQVILPCPGKPDNMNNNENGETGMNQLRSRLSAAFQQSPKINIEAEVDRLVGAAKSYSEREKFKLKQYYEEEIRRTKKNVIQEFKCAMEREIIAPLKTKLCSYETEIQRLRKELENACQYQQRASYESKDNLYKYMDKSQLERDLLDAELDKAHAEKRGLTEMIKSEIIRKSIRSGSSLGISFSGNPTEAGKDGRKSGISSKGRSSQGGSDNGGEEITGETEQEILLEESTGNNKNVVSGENVMDQEIHEDTHKLLSKIKELTEALDHAQKFTEEEIQDLIKESELSAQLKQNAEELNLENEELKRRIEELLQQLVEMQPPRGSIEDENLNLRKRIQELESTRGKGSLEAELGSLKQQLEEAQQLKAEEEQRIAEEEKARSQRNVGGEEYFVEEEVQTEQLEDEPNQNVNQSKSARSSRSGKGSIDDKSQKRTSTSSKGSEKGKCILVHERRCSIITKNLEQQIDDLTERIRELEDQLQAFAEMERRIKELEAQLLETEGLKKRTAELSRELAIVRAIEPPVCEIPEPDDTENRELREKLSQMESLSTRRLDDFASLSTRANDLEAQNADLAKSLAEMKVISNKAEQLESMHAQVLEEKRRKSEQCNNLAVKLSNLEAEKARTNKELEDKLKKLEELAKELARLKEENSNISGELSMLRDKAQRSTFREDDLLADLKNKNETLAELRPKISALEAENESLKKQLSDLRRQLDDLSLVKANLEAELSHFKRQLDETDRRYQTRLEEQAKKCAQDTSEMSKKGQCILEHEKRCLVLTGQLEEDNTALQDRIRQLEAQLEAFVMMENKTKVLHQEMEELQKRATVRTRELELLRNMPASCELGPIPSDWQVGSSSAPNLSDQQPWPAKNLQLPESSRQAEDNKRRKSHNCHLLAAQFADLETEKCALNTELKAKLEEVEDINRQIAGIQDQNDRLRSEVNQACEASAEHYIAEALNRQQQLPSTVPTAAILKVDTYFVESNNDESYRKKK